MEKKHEIVSNPVSSSHLDLKKSFKLAVRSLLTSCSREEFRECFPKFSSAEQDYLHRLFIQVITSLHGNIEDEFESLCIETQVGIILDNVEQILEEQGLDPLYSKKTNIMDIANYLSMEKKNEIQHLTDMLKMVEEQNHCTKSRVDHLRKGMQDASSMTEAVEKLRRKYTVYETHGSKGTYNA